MVRQCSSCSMAESLQPRLLADAVRCDSLQHFCNRNTHLAALSDHKSVSGRLSKPTALFSLFPQQLPPPNARMYLEHWPRPCTHGLSCRYTHPLHAQPPLADAPPPSTMANNSPRLTNLHRCPNAILPTSPRAPQHTNHLHQ
jgi:hypothetical protein